MAIQSETLGNFKKCVSVLAVRYLHLHAYNGKCKLYAHVWREGLITRLCMWSLEIAYKYPLLHWKKREAAITTDMALGALGWKQKQWPHTVKKFSDVMRIGMVHIVSGMLIIIDVIEALW